MLLHSPNPLSHLPAWHTVEISSGVISIFSPVQCSVQPPLAACRKAKLKLPPFTFFDAPGLLVSWSELAPLRPEDLEIILLGPWGIYLIPCLLSLVLGQWSAWSAVEFSQRAATTLSSLDQLSDAWCMQAVNS